MNTPKPLARVHGVRIIDRLIDALLDAGISEIYIVRGYLAEEFDQLLHKYPDVEFIDNPLYSTTNNISSAVAACSHFSNAYVFESDLLLTNPGLVAPYQYRSNYLGIKVDSTDDWRFVADESGKISDLAKGDSNRVGKWSVCHIGRLTMARHLRAIFLRCSIQKMANRFSGMT